MYFHHFFFSKALRDSAVDIAIGYRLDDRRVGARVPLGARFFYSPRRPDRFWGPPNLLSLSPGIKLPGREATITAEVKNKSP
jgi:hypothetical protein